ncbi:WxL domain-containing protein (plasmid) [Enterococcus faecium]|uniref:WxL domain-containing protein n=1 Tax=Enterococcus faecium TaxID=1352 RepID=UPI0038D45E0B
MKKFTSLFSAGIILSTMVGGGLTAFADVTGSETVDTKETPVQAIFELPTDGGTNPSVPDDPNGDDNTNNNSDKAFAIAYQPKKFDFGTVKLQDEGQQTIESTNTKSLHVGVKDKQRENIAWTLKADLEWTSANKDQMTGTYIQVDNASVAVNKEGTLTDPSVATNDGVTGPSSFQIGSSSIDIMNATAKQRNDVYDMNLGEKVKLVLPNAKNVAAGTYDGKVTWTLESAPK